MLTILAHLVFWPALFINVVLWVTVATAGIRRGRKLETAWNLFCALGILLIPGIYLFGIW